MCNIIANSGPTNLDPSCMWIGSFVDFSLRTIQFMMLPTLLMHTCRERLCIILYTVIVNNVFLCLSFFSYCHIDDITLYHCIIISLYHFIIASLHHWIIVSLPHCIISSLYHYIIESVCQCIIASSYQCIIESLYHCINVSLYHCIIIS